MQASDHADDLALLVDAAHAAGELAMRYWQKSPVAWEKAENAGPVSEADLAVNDLLSALLRTARPDYGWLSEESPDDPARLSAERVFIIDPIDGTRAFLNGDSGFAHAIAVAERGRITAAVVSLPARDETYCATIDGVATLNGEAIHPSGVENIDGCTVLTSSMSDNPDFWRGDPPAYRRSLRPSLAWRLCLVAAGRFDATLSMRPAWEWDIAAASLIAERAGCRVTDRNGSPILFNHPSAQSRGLIVAPPVLHDQFMRNLRPFPQTK